MMLLLALAGLLVAARAVLMPNLPGPFPVAVRSQDLTDARRWDPYAPKGKPHLRRLMVSVFLPLVPRRPACAVERVPYMPPKTAAIYDQLAAAGGFPNQTFSRFELELCELPKARVPRAGRFEPQYPVVVFSPGFGASRLLYSAGARALASQGYVVVTVDHPYDSTVVEFPDGSMILSANISVLNPDELARALQVRVADVSFVVDQLRNATALQQLAAGLSGCVDVDKVAAYGHSLGGATSAAVMMTDDRILGGLNFDGHIFGPVSNRGLDNPFILAGTPGHAAMPNSLWPELYAHLRGAKMDVAVANTTHLSYSDLSLLAWAMDIPDKLKPAVDATVGTINGRRMQVIMTGMVTALLDLVFGGRAESLRNLEHDLCDVSVSKRQLPGGR